MKRSCSLDNVSDGGHHHLVLPSLATKQHVCQQVHDREVKPSPGTNSHLFTRSKSLEMLAIVCDRVIPRMQLYGPTGDRTRSASWAMNYKTAFANDNLIIIESPKAQSISSNESTTSSLGEQSPSPTPSTQASDDVELPKPDTVRRTRDTFETLARKTAQEVAVEQERQKVRRSMSSPSLKRNDHSTGTPPPTPASSLIRPDFQVFANFNNSSESEWKDRDRGSPVSPQVIRKLREHCTSVTYFGGRAYISDSEEEVEDDYDGANNTYNGDEDGPELDNVTPPEVSSSPVFFSFSWPRSRTPSPSSPKVIGVLCKNGNGVRGHSGVINLRHGYSTTEPGNHMMPGILIQDGHGVWNPNPRWLGSYYVRFNFTQPMFPNEVHRVLELPRKKLTPDKYPPLLTSSASFSRADLPLSR